MSDKIGIAVDSTIDLPEGMREDLGLHIIPVHIFVDGQDHLHGVNISNKEVVAYLKQNREVHTTPYFPSECADIFEKLLLKYDRIVSFHISTELSGNYQSAINSLNLLFADEAEKIKVIDTHNVCIGQGLLVKKAVDSLQKGLSPQELEPFLTSFQNTSFLCFTVDNLIWLKKGGRVSSFSAFVGSMLNIKPIIELEDAKLVPKEKHMGRSSAIDRMIQMTTDYYTECNRDCDIWVAHVDDIEGALSVVARLSRRLELKPEHFRVVDIGATIAVHSGPGSVCIAALKK